MRGALLLVGLLLLLAAPARADAIDDARDADVQRDWADAADAWVRVLDAEPENREAAFGLARAVREGERWAQFPAAEKALGALLEKDGDDAEVRLAIGRLFLARAPMVAQAMYRATFYARSKAHFRALVDADEKHEQAVIGLARTLVGTDHVDDAIQVLDDFLAHQPKEGARALHWKARILYQQGQAKHKAAGGGYPLSAKVQRLYGRAQGAAMSSAAADPTQFDTWMYLAWTSTLLGDRETAHTAYERAYALDPNSPLPLKGLASLNAHDPVAKAKALERLKRLDPERRRARLKEGYDLVAQKKWDEVEAFVEGYMQEFGEDADARYCLGKALQGRLRGSDAQAEFVRALELNGEHLAAAEELDKKIRKNAVNLARNSVPSARTLYDNYAVLMRLAPRNPYVRNNAAFALREAWSHHKGDPNWRQILMLCARTYEEGARLIGSRRPDEDLPFAERYAYAQMVNDTGIVFQLYEPIRDYARAERYLLRALGWIDDGYVDAWTYLKTIYTEQARWQELHDLALRCAKGLVDAKGEPAKAQREAAQKLADELARDGRATR